MRECAPWQYSEWQRASPGLQCQCTGVLPLLLLVLLLLL